MSGAGRPPEPTGPVGGYGLGLPPGVSTDSAYQKPGGGGVEPSGLVGLILGVLSLPLWFCCGGFSVALNLVGLALAFTSLTRIRSAPDRYGSRGVAIAALIVNGVFLLLNAALILFVFGMMGVGILTGP